MQIYDFSKKADKDKLQELFQRHFKRQDIILFFGSGFTRGCSATRGLVPSVDELKTEMIDIIAAIERYSNSDRNELAKMALSELADSFWDSLDREEAPQPYGVRFEHYVADHFCGVHDLPVEHQGLIDCRWRYLYTLNYDDAIERASDKLTVIMPYSGQNKRYLADRRCLYKIHGDSAKFLETGDRRYWILSTRQYLQAMASRENETVSQNLETDFASSNLIFLGCSLLDELDILFAAGTEYANEKQQNEDTHSYYVRYITKKDRPLTAVQKRKFEKFAVTDIIEVKAEDMLSFYSFLIGISNEAEKLQKADSLSEFTGIHFSRLDSTDRLNIEYLFISSRIWPDPKTKLITLPGAFTRRDIVQQAIDNINASDGHVHVLRGRRLSGKTYALVDLLMEFQSRNTYYFPSSKSISNDCLKRLLSIKDAILIFDEHSLNSDQLNDITSKYRNNIQKNSIQIVTAVDRSTGMFTGHYFDHFPEREGFVKIYQLPSKLSESEAAQFNSEFGKLGLIDYEKDWSLLDLMLKVDETSTQKHGSGLPDINIIRDIEVLKALVLFANNETILVSQGNIMGITETLFDLCKKADIAIQKDYLWEAERAPEAHESLRFVTNSKFWIYKCLTAYAKDKSHYDNIATAFYEIAKAIQRQYSNHYTQRYYQAIKPYYFFETIQFTFFAVTGSQQASGTLFLPDKIYEKLLPLFRDDFQFLHQKAKCILWNSRRKKKTKDRADALNRALQQIERARSLAEKVRPLNMEYTLYHMCVTKVLILVNNWRFCEKQFTENARYEQLTLLLDTLREVEHQMLSFGSDSELDEQEMEDINWFVGQFVAPEHRPVLLPKDRKTAEEIVNLWRTIRAVI